MSVDREDEVVYYYAEDDGYEVELRVYTYKDTTRKTYLLKNNIQTMQFNEDEFDLLHQLLEGFLVEQRQEEGMIQHLWNSFKRGRAGE